MAKAAGAALVRPMFNDPMSNDQRVVLEGGAIDVNGEGLLITTEECLLSPTQQRNPSMNRDAYDRMLPTTWESSQ